MIKITDAQVQDAWSKAKSIKGVARALGVQEQKARRLLLTAGVKLDSPTTRRINALRAQGMQIGQLVQLTGLSRQAVISHLPYDRGQLCPWTDEERANVLHGADAPERGHQASILMRHRLKSPQRVYHDTPLRRARRAAGLTQSELADKSGISISYIRDAEQGRARPESMSLDVLRALASALGCDLKKLYENNK